MERFNDLIRKLYTRAVVGIIIEYAYCGTISYPNPKMAFFAVGSLQIFFTSLAKLHINFWRRNYFFNFSTPVYKMRIIREPNTLEL